MKAFLIISLAFGSCLHLFSQVVFSPPGAEWNYNFTNYGYNSTLQYADNETVKYIRDTLIGSDSCKILSHTRYFSTRNTSFTPKLTFIKQKSDSVLYRNPTTQNTWQLLYNYGAQPGEKWVNFYVNPSYIVITNTITVNSVSNINTNGVTLKRLTVSISFGENNNLTSTITETITERYGSGQFLFGNYLSYYGMSFTDQVERPLCYKDNKFGVKKFSSLSCDFSDPTGIVNYDSSDSRITLFPNPVATNLMLNYKDGRVPAELDVYLINALGAKARIEITESSEDYTGELDLSNFESGIYFLQIFENGTLILSKKIIKQ